MTAHAITARQIKAARALLDWSQEELAAASDLSIATIRKLELGHISPRGTTTEHIRKAFEDAGLEFIEPNGVRHKPEDITVYHGRKDVETFFDDVYHSSKKSGGDIVQVWPTSYKFNEVIGDYKSFHYARMTVLAETVPVKSLVTENQDTTFIAPYCECRFISKNYVYAVPFYIYADKYAIIMPDVQNPPKITVIRSATLAEAFRHQFYSMWEKATPLNKVERGDSVTRLKPRVSARR